MRHDDLEQAASYLMLFALCLLGASLIGLAMALVRIGLTFIGMTTPL